MVYLGVVSNEVDKGVFEVVWDGVWVVTLLKDLVCYAINMFEMV